MISLWPVSFKPAQNMPLKYYHFGVSKTLIKHWYWPMILHSHWWLFLFFNDNFTTNILTDHPMSVNMEEARLSTTKLAKYCFLSNFKIRTSFFNANTNYYLQFFGTFFVFDNIPLWYWDCIYQNKCLTQHFLLLVKKF